MMISTKSEKIEFGREANPQPKKELDEDTSWNRSERIEEIKMPPQEMDEGSFSGYKNINFSDQNMKEIYRELNKILGGD